MFEIEITVVFSISFFYNFVARLLVDWLLEKQLMKKKSRINKQFWKKIVTCKTTDILLSVSLEPKKYVLPTFTQISPTFYIDFLVVKIYNNYMTINKKTIFTKLFKH